MTLSIAEQLERYFLCDDNGHLVDRKHLLDLLEYPFGEDNLQPRMHSRAKKEWEKRIMEIGAGIVGRDNVIRSLLSFINRQNEALEFYGDGFGYEQEIDNGEKAAEALREAAPIIAVMEKMK